MDNLLIKYASDPKNSGLNFELAVYYNHIQHYAGACSYYLRCAEWGDLETDKDIIYESLLHISLCFRALGNRNWTEEGWLLHSVSLCPERPEAYWLLSQIYERTKKWQESYTMAAIGLNCISNQKPMHYDIGFKGEYVLAFQKMVAAWYVPRIGECREILFSMPDRYDLDEDYIKFVQNNMNIVGRGPARIFPFYQSEYLDRFRFHFHGIKNIKKNFSQVFQDMFVLAMHNGKEKGYYLEIGAGDPVHINNTYLLETQFNWRGISIEIKDDLVKLFRQKRKNPVFSRDATQINYLKFLNENNAPHDIDYLQIDCEPPENSYRILTSLPFDRYRFGVITFEHDNYCDASRRYKQLSRNFLKGLGYVLVFNNISPEIGDDHDFEDWWAHPEIIDPEILRRMTIVDDTVKAAEKYFYDDKPYKT
jgi:hypothetical protein